MFARRGWRNLSKENWCPGRNSNSVPLEHESVKLLLAQVARLPFLPICLFLRNLFERNLHSLFGKFLTVNEELFSCQELTSLIPSSVVLLAIHQSETWIILTSVSVLHYVGKLMSSESLCFHLSRWPHCVLELNALKMCKEWDILGSHCYTPFRLVENLVSIFRVGGKAKK